MTKVVKKENLEAVYEVLQHEEVVAFPTETVFGLGVKYGSHLALDRLMEAKERDNSKAITLMVSKKEDIEKYAYINDKSQKLIDHFMPGMITLVFQKKENVDDYMTNGQKTIGIRIPDSQYVLTLLENVGPMLVTSANLSGRPNTTTTLEVLRQLDGRITMIVDGKTSDSIASTVVDVSQDDICILREGKITKEEIEEVLR